MNKIIIKAQRLDEELEHDQPYTWELKSVEELYNFRRMQIPFEHYTHVYVTINIENKFRAAMISNPMRIGETVFNRIKNWTFGIFVPELFR
jgi:hypothetical protein